MFLFDEVESHHHGHATASLGDCHGHTRFLKFFLLLLNELDVTVSALTADSDWMFGNGT